MKASLFKILYWFILALFPILSVILIYMGVQEISLVQVLKSDGKEANAQIIKKEAKQVNQGNIIYALSLQINDSSDLVDYQVEEQLFNRYQEGEEITIIYLADHPKTLKIKDEKLSFISGIFRLLMGVGILIFFLWYVYRRFRG